MNNIKYPVGKSFTLKDCCGRVDVWKVIEHKGFVKVLNSDMQVEVFMCESIKPVMGLNGYVTLCVLTSLFNSADERLKDLKPTAKLIESSNSRINPKFNGILSEKVR